jgi:hypothetical protein
MLLLFQVCFLTGVLYTIISFILGHLLDFTGVDGHIDTHVDMHIDSHIDLGSHFSDAGVSPLKPITIAAFVTVFGGTGMILIRNNFNPLISAAAAAALGFVVSFVLYRFIVVPLYKAQNTSAVSQIEIIGSLAHAALPMTGGSFGRITYAIEGNIYSAPAKSIDGEVIAKGAPVVIIDIKKNVFYVKEIKGGSM